MRSNRSRLSIGVTLLLAALATLVGAPPVLAARQPIPSVAACTGSWQIQASPNNGVEDNELRGVAASSATDAWAVGDYISSRVVRTLILRWDGTSWTQVPSPNVGSGVNILNAVAARSATHAEAVGFYFAHNGDQRALAMRWNGTSWKVLPSENGGVTGNQLESVTSVKGATWAVGQYLDDASGYSQTLILRREGSSWVRVSSPNSGPLADNTLSSVSAANSKAAWALGSFSAAGQGGPMIERWNGNKWSVVKVLNMPRRSFGGVAAQSPTNVLVVGTHGGHRLAPIAERYDGTSWSETALPSPGGLNVSLEGAAWSSPVSAWAIGASLSGLGGQLAPLVEQFDGSSWTLVPIPLAGARNFLSSVTARPTESWMVGAYRKRKNSSLRTLIERYC